MSEWKLVPVEPTAMMFSATREQYWEAFQADYSAMLAAAPDAPQAEPVFYVHLDGIRAMPPDIFAAWSPTAKQTAHEYRPVFDHPPPDELARLRAENERLRADAGRFQWLARADGCPFSELDDVWNVPGELAKRIDAAMARGEV